MVYVGMPLNHPTSDDPRVRLTIYLAVERDRFKGSTPNGQLIDKVTSIANPGTVSANVERARNLNQAKRLLVEAGYEDGFAVRLVAADVISEWAAVQIANDLAELFNWSFPETPYIDVAVLSPEAFLSQYRQETPLSSWQLPLFVATTDVAWNDTPSLLGRLLLSTGQENFTGYNSQDFERLFNEGFIEQAEALAFEAPAIIPLFWTGDRDLTTTPTRTPRVVGPFDRMVYIGMPLNHPVFEDPRVRLAIYLAVNRDRFKDSTPSGQLIDKVTKYPPNGLAVRDFLGGRGPAHSPAVGVSLHAQARELAEHGGNRVQHPTPTPTPVPGLVLHINGFAVPAGQTIVPVPYGQVLLYQLPQSNGTYPPSTAVTMQARPIAAESRITFGGVDSQFGSQARVLMNSDRYVAVLISPPETLPTPTPTPPPTATPAPTPISEGVYTLIVDQSGASFAGKTVSFKVGDLWAKETATWQQGGATQLNLTASSSLGILPDNPRRGSDGDEDATSSKGGLLASPIRQAPPPHVFAGTATVDGEPAPLGTSVTAWVGGVLAGVTTVK